MRQTDVPRLATAGQPPVRELELPVVVLVRPVKRRLKPAHVWRGRQVIRVMTARDFKVKYKQSLLGPLWLLFQPIALLVAFLVAFRNLANVQPGVPYSVFALAGLSSWAFFQASMTMGTASIISNVHLVRFTPCPRFVFPIAGILASTPVCVVTMAGAVIAAGVTGVLSPRALLLPLAALWLFLLTTGSVALAAAYTVRFRDILQAMPFLLQVGLFLAPVGYPLRQLGGTIRSLVELNPVTGLIEASRWMLISGYHPSTRSIAFSLVISAIVVFGGWRTFARLETTMADEI